MATVWYLFVDKVTRSGFDSEARWSDSTFEVIVAEKR